MTLTPDGVLSKSKSTVSAAEDGMRRTLMLILLTRSFGLGRNLIARFSCTQLGVVLRVALAPGRYTGVVETCHWDLGLDLGWVDGCSKILVRKVDYGRD